MNTKIFLILVLSLSIFGCSDGPNTVLPDGGIFADSDVSPDLSVEDDLGVEVDSDVPPADLGVDSAVVEDSAVVVDLGPDVSVPNDLGTPDVGVDSGTVVVDYFPPGENVYYVWVANVDWNGLTEAEDVCVSHGGHFPSPHEGVNMNAVATEISSLLRATNNSGLRPAGLDCDYPVETDGFSCANFCDNLVCELDCQTDSVGSACLFRADLVSTNSVVSHAQIVSSVLTFRTFTRNGSPDYASSTTASNTNIICVIPESGDFTTGVVGSPNYSRILSNHYTSFNAL